jgi:cytochrome c oxidase subunit III
VKRLELGEQYADWTQQDHTLRFGMWVFLASEVLLFAALFALYGGYRAMYGEEFYRAVKHNTLPYGTVNTYILLSSSFTVALSVWATRKGHYRLIIAMLATTIALGAAFLLVKSFEYIEHYREGALPGPYYHLAALPTLGANRFYTLYWVMTGLHAFHVTGGLIVLAWLLWRASHRFYTPTRHVTLEMGTLYWHLIDVIWIFLWPLLYLA